MCPDWPESSRGFVMSEVTMRFIRVTPDSTREELVEAVAHLRAKRAACELPVIQTEIDDDVDELVALIVAREAVGA